MIRSVGGSFVVACAVAALAELTVAAAPAATTEQSQGAGSSRAPILIDHDPVGCVVAAQHPSFEARFDPAGSVRNARLLFRPAGGGDWYSVAMEPRGGTFTGILPKPKPDLAGLDYYIEVIGEGAESSRTAEHSPVVEAGPEACRDKKVAGMLGQAVVKVLAPKGAPLVPAGFSSAGAVAAGNATAAGAANAGEASGGSGAAAGGISSKVLILGGVAAAGVAGVAVAAGGGGGEDAQGTQGTPTASSPTTSPTTTPTTTPPTTVPPVSLTGQWSGVQEGTFPLTLGNCAGGYRLTLRSSHNPPALTGQLELHSQFISWSAPGITCEPNSGQISGEIREGTASNGSLRFRVQVVVEGLPLEFHYEGTYTSGTMSGTLRFVAAHDTQDWTWSAQRN